MSANKAYSHLSQFKNVDAHELSKIHMEHTDDSFGTDPLPTRGNSITSRGVHPCNLAASLPVISQGDVSGISRDGMDDRSLGRIVVIGYVAVSHWRHGRDGLTG